MHDMMRKLAKRQYTIHNKYRGVGFVSPKQESYLILNFEDDAFGMLRFYGHAPGYWEWRKELNEATGRKIRLREDKLKVSKEREIKWVYRKKRIKDPQTGKVKIVEVKPVSKSTDKKRPFTAERPKEFDYLW